MRWRAGSAFRPFKSNKIDQVDGCHSSAARFPTRADERPERPRTSGMFVICSIPPRYEGTSYKTSTLAALPSFPIDQDRLLPSAGRLVGPMDAPCPTAGALLAFAQFVAGSRDAALAGRRCFGVLHPADELVAPERSERFPLREQPRLRAQRRLEVVASMVNSAMEKSVRHESTQQCQSSGGHSTMAACSAH